MEDVRASEFAQARSVQLLTNFAHDVSATRALATEMKYGEYVDRVIEVNAPSGYVLNETEQIVTFEYVNDRTPVIRKNVDFNNDRQKLSMNIIKKDSETNEGIAGSKFGLYANEDIINYNGKVIVNAGTLLETSVLDENGVVAFLKDYPFATYVASEVETPAGYVSSDETVAFNAMYQGQKRQVAEYISEFINSPTTIEVSKKDITTEVEIGGAIFIS